MFDETTAQRDIESLRDHAMVYLGGSRRMHQRDIDGIIRVDESTDYDYYMTYSQEAHELLVKRGWNSTGTKSHYYDSEALLILEKDNHQIVLRRNAEFYNQVFERIPVKFYHNYLWKKNPGVDRSQIQSILEVLFDMRRP